MTGPASDVPRSQRLRVAGEVARRTVDEQRLALRAASLYHLEGATQAEIAAKLGVSRPTAGRLVARARAQGLVRIEVQLPRELRGAVHAELERELERTYGLDEALVVGHDTYQPLLDYAEIGRAAASVLVRRLQPGDTAGFTWGPETVAVADALPGRGGSCARVVQLDGALTTTDYQTGAEYVLGRCSEQLRAGAVRLPAPLYADPATVTALQQDSGLSQALALGRGADVMFFGIGPVGAATTLFEGSFLDDAVLREVSALGAVGEIGGRFFDADGADVGGSLPARTVSVPLDDVRRCRASLLVSGGAAKHDAIRGALRGGLATVLVTDIGSATALLEDSTS